MRILAIDPGLKKTGWCVFDTEEGYVCSSVISVKNRSSDWVQKLDFVVIRVLNLISSYHIGTVIVEQPQLFLSSWKGQAASNSGAVLKLTALVFSIRAAAGLYKRRPECVLVTVRKWKGSTPKRITQRRIKRQWGVSPKDDNEADAVGLGSYYLREVLRVEKFSAL